MRFSRAHWVSDGRVRSDQLESADPRPRAQQARVFVAKHHQRSHANGWRVVTYVSPNRMGLISLSGTSSRPSRTDPGGEIAECRR